MSPLEALAAGCHVFIEKPLASTTDDADRICDAAAVAPGVAAVGHLLRFDPRMRWIREMITSGQLGDLISIDLARDGARMLNDIYSSVSPMMQGGVHDLDLCEWLTGREIRSIECRSVSVDRYRSPVSMTALAELDGGALATIRASRTLADHVHPQPATWLSVTTTKASISMSDFQPPVLTLSGADAVGQFAVPDRHAPSVDELLALQLSAFVAAIEGDDRGELASPDSARRAVWAAAKAERSAAR